MEPAANKCSDVSEELFVECPFAGRHVSTTTAMPGFLKAMSQAENARKQYVVQCLDIFHAERAVHITSLEELPVDVKETVKEGSDVVYDEVSRRALQ